MTSNIEQSDPLSTMQYKHLKEDATLQSLFPDLSTSRLSLAFPGSPDLSDVNNHIRPEDDLSMIIDILESANHVVNQSDMELEPTPLGPQGVQDVVHAIPIPSNTWKTDTSFADALQPLVCESSDNHSYSNPSRKRDSFFEQDCNAAPAKRFRRYQSDQWADRFQELEMFRAVHGNCHVPHSFPENQQLAQWVKRQRYQYKLKQMNRSSTLTDDRKEMLEAIGFVWDSHKAAWEEKYEALLSFFARHGHTNVPSNYEDKTLAIWIKCQRRQYKLCKKGLKSTINAERINKMNSLGFVWNPRNL